MLVDQRAFTAPLESLPKRLVLALPRFAAGGLKQFQEDRRRRARIPGVAETFGCLRILAEDSTHLGHVVSLDRPPQS